MALRLGTSRVKHISKYEVIIIEIRKTKNNNYIECSDE